MKKSYSLCVSLALALLVCLSHPLMAQRTVTGKVVDETGPLPGVNVLLKGTTNGTVTNGEGVYTLAVTGDSPILVFSSIGFATQEVTLGSRSSVDVTLVQDVQQLSEVVVTALGIQREKKALQYSVTEVGGDNFTQARENNLGSALSGRIAGVNVSKVASGPAGSSRIIIRGNKTLGGQNQPLYVVDGMPMDNGNFGQAGLWGGRDEGDGLASINPDDIESITVLKGANASALYGSRGGNGVINITTKKGTNRKGLGIEVNTNYVFENVMNLTDLQTKYGHGNYRDLTADGIANGTPVMPVLDTTDPTTTFNSYARSFGDADDSWGPAMDGATALYPDGKERPYTYAGDNWERFYNTGSAMTNSLAITGGGDKQTFRFSMADLRSDGVIPNSGFDRTNATLSTNARFADKLTVDAKVIYSHEYAKNRPVLSDSPANANQTVWRMPPSLNLTDYIGDPAKPGAIPAGLDPLLYTAYAQGNILSVPKIPGQEFLIAANNWGQNPYWATQQFINDDVKDRIITQGQLRYDITSFLYAQGRMSMDWQTRQDMSLTPQGTGYDLNGGRNVSSNRRREINMEYMVGFNKAFDKIHVNAFMGGNRMRSEGESYNINGAGFSVPFFPSIANTVTRTWGYGYGISGINSVFGSAEVAYNNYLFLTTTFREDWWSVLSSASGLGKNHLPYMSAGASFVFSDAIANLPSWLSFGKVRASWAESGFIGDLGAYGTDLTYSLNGNTHLGYTMATYTQAGGNNGTIPNPALQPAKSTEIEGGIDVRMFNNRFGVDLTLYTQTTTNDILSAQISRSSGFGFTRVNVGELQNKGVEILLTGTPVRGAVTWDVSLNMARNRNKVISLLDPANPAEELVLEEPRTRNVFIKHIEGQPFGMITGRVQRTDPNGTPLFGTGGSPVASANYVPIGNGIADWTGGLNNSVTWKGVNLSFLLDFKIGGDVFSGTNNRLTQWGLHQQSVIGRDGETPLHITGAIPSGSGASETYAPVDRDLTAHEARNYWSNVGGEATAISNMFIYDASFVKLRQLTLGYSLPRAVLSKTPLQNVTISMVGRNLGILFKNVPNIDPESAYSANAGAQGLEYFAMPPTRSWGFNLRLGF